jgi:hypothetical protein
MEDVIMNALRKLNKYLTLAYLGIFALVLVGCGSSGGDAEQTVNGLIKGSAVKGPVANADISGFTIAMNGMKGELIGTVHTDNEGNFTLMIGSHSGPVLLEMSGGHYTDEATGTMMNVTQGDIMTSAIPAFRSGEIMDGVLITPLTSMAQTMAQNMTDGMTGENITAAHNAVGMYFDVSDILQIHPMNPLMDGAGNLADPDMIHYGMVLASMSEYAKTMNLDTCSVVTSLMNDISDGQLDGMMGGSGIMMRGRMMSGGMMGSEMVMPTTTGTVGLAEAMEDFIHSPMNRSGVNLNDMKPLIDQMHMSSGTFQ